MRFYFSLSFLLSVSLMLFATASSAASVNLTEILGELPPCSLNCILSELTSSGIALNNVGAMCMNETLQASLSGCVQRQCNFTEQFEVGIANQQLCKGVPFTSRFWLILIWGLVLCPTALICILLRCYARLSITREFGPDDWVIVSVGAFLTILVGLDVANAMKGFGRHFWNIDPFNFKSILQIFWVSEVFYIVVSTLVRVSILLFYLRVFAVRSFKNMALIVMALVIATGTAVTLVIIFQCRPISGVWNRSINYKCINVNILAYAAGGTSIALDITVLILPIPQILKLKTNLRKKISLMFVFGLGSLACITSIIRLKFIINLSTSLDQAWGNAIPAIWSLLETSLNGRSLARELIISVATICACLPAIRILLAKWFPYVFELNTLPRSEPKYNAGAKQNSSSSSDYPLHDIPTKSSHNKRVIQEPDEVFLVRCRDVNNSFNDMESGVSTNIWAQQTNFDNRSSKSEAHKQSPFATTVPTTTPKMMSSYKFLGKSTESVPFDHPRISSETIRFAEEVKRAFKTPKEGKREDREIRIVDTFILSSRRVSEDG